MMAAIGERSKNEDRVASYYVAECQLLTVGSFGREPILAGEAVMHMLRTVLAATKRVAPFENVAFVFLPDHLHLLLRAEDGVNTDAIVNDLTSRFQHDYRQLMGLPTSGRLFLQSYERRSVQGESNFSATLDTIHYDPVHHGVAERPEEWPHSSYQSWVERGVYKLGWGWEQPDSLKKKKSYRGFAG
jgi:putative transposase